MPVTPERVFEPCTLQPVGGFRVDRPGQPPRRVMTRAHWHDVLEVNYVRQGRGHYLIDGRSYDLSPGTVFVIPAGVAHRTRPLPTNPHWNLTVYFRPEGLAPLGDRAVAFGTAVAGRVRRIPAGRFADLWENVFSGLEREGRHGDPAGSLAACAKVLDACLLVSRCAEAAKGEPGIDLSPAARYVQGMMEHVRQHLDAPLTLRAIAAAVGLHPNYACSVFREQTGTPLFAYVAQQRATRARTLLATSTLPVAEVARRCGFRSIPSFYRVIRTAYGTTPAGLRDLLLS